MTFGPTLGALVIRISGHALSVFYAATLIHFVYGCMAWFVIPESLSQRQMDLLRQKYVAEGDGSRERSAPRVFAFLRPLCLLMPKIRDRERINGNPLNSKGRDWTLTLVAAAYGCTITLFVGNLTPLIRRY